jgi:hypothetical protein
MEQSVVSDDGVSRADTERHLVRVVSHRHVVEPERRGRTRVRLRKRFVKITTAGVGSR